MDLFKPEVGLLIWMFIPFLVVFIVLAKYAWPYILKGVEDRGNFIDESIRTAKEANERLANIKEEGEKILADARAEQLRILSEANSMRDQLIDKAKTDAKTESEKLITAAAAEIKNAKNAALSEIRAEVALLSVEVAHKLMRGQLDKQTAQTDMIDKLLSEINIQ